MGAIVGRDAESSAIEAFLDRSAAGPRALVIDGAAGIGKSTLWMAAVAAARDRGFTVIASRPAETERLLANVVLGDLFHIAHPGVSSPTASAVRWARFSCTRCVESIVSQRLTAAPISRSAAARLPHRTASMKGPVSGTSSSRPVRIVSTAGSSCSARPTVALRPPCPSWRGDCQEGPCDRRALVSASQSEPGSGVRVA